MSVAIQLMIIHGKGMIWIWSKTLQVFFFLMAGTHCWIPCLVTSEWKNKMAELINGMRSDLGIHINFN